MIQFGPIMVVTRSDCNSCGKDGEWELRVNYKSDHQTTQVTRLCATCARDLLVKLANNVVY